MAIDPITAARLGLTAANIAGVGLPSIGGFPTPLGVFSGFGKHTSSAARQARLMASFQGTAGGKSAFDTQRTKESLSSGIVLDSFQNMVTFKQRDDIFKQPHTAIITRGNFFGAFDIEHRTPQELLDNLKGKNLGGGSAFGGAGVFLTSGDTIRDATKSIYSNLLQFDPNKALEFKGLTDEIISFASGDKRTAQESLRLGGIFSTKFFQSISDAFDPNFVRKPQQQPQGPQGKSPIEIGDLARLALNFVPGGKRPRLRTGFVGGTSFAEQSKEQDLIIPPGFTSKQPTTLARAIDPNILNGVR
ncbi:hypothetical protein LCGC14_1998260 [marine sediment metagenome]|uniref:Uncharacterized protein n=1 Tax=marine sediment metagenome TaxID=412755 RepID=A0A0F9I127_9ZZZZ